MSFIAKSYVYYSYAPDGTFMGRWADVISDLNISQDLNTAGCAIQVTLGRSIDKALNTVSNLITEASEDITTEASEILQVDTYSRNRVGAGTDVDIHNRINIFVFYQENEILIDETGDSIITDTSDEIYLTSEYNYGRKIFTGTIEDYEATYGDDSNVIVTIVSDGIELDNKVIFDSSGTGTKTNVTFSSQDPSAILKTILDQNVSAGGKVTYDSGSIDMTGTTVTYSFKLNTILEGVQKLKELAPSDWFWYVDPATQLMHFRTRNQTPDHIFYLGVHIDSLKIKRTKSNIVNRVFFMGGDTGGGVYLYKRYVDNTSVTNYGTRAKRITDQRITNGSVADTLANSLINENKDPKLTGEVTILTRAYDIESIQLGDVVAFRNFDNFLDTTQLLVAGYTYTPESKTLRLEILPPAQNKRIEEIKRDLQREETLNIPDDVN